MATQSTDREWENAVIGTVITSSLLAILLGVFQLAEGEMIGVVPILVGCGGALLLFFLADWNERQQELSDQISWIPETTFGNDPRSTLQEQYARGDIDLAEFNRRLRRLQASDSDEDADPDDPTTDREIVSRRN
jgi:uncharacterized membrane protein